MILNFLIFTTFVFKCWTQRQTANPIHDPLEKVICNYLFNHFVSNKLFTPSQSGFQPEESCMAQVFSIIHKIQSNFDSNPPADVRGAFLDISKAFDNVWHKGLLYK